MSLLEHAGASVIVFAFYLGVFGLGCLLGWGLTRKPKHECPTLPAHPPCYFCGVSEYEHRQECPVAHYRQYLKPPTLSATKVNKAWMDRMLKTRTSTLTIMPSEIEVAVECPIIDKRVVWDHSNVKPQFKPGQWVRRVGGEISWLLKVARMDSDPKFFHGLDERSDLMIAQVSNYEPAIPRKGEFWDKESCGKHPWTPHPNAWPEANLSEWILCGCFHPVNFGKGNS